MDGFFTGLSPENLSLDAYDIAHIIFLEIRIGFFTDAVSGHIGLNIALQILHIAEGSLPHDTFGHHTARDGHLLSLQRLEVILDFLAVMGHVIFRDLKRVFAVLLQCGQLLPSHLQKLVDILILYFCHTDLHLAARRLFKYVAYSQQHSFNAFMQ